MLSKLTTLTIPPKYPAHFLLGALPEARRDPLGMFIKAAREYGDVVRLRFGPYTSYLVNHPDGIKHVLQTNHKNYRLAPFVADLFSLVSGLNLITSDGEHWKHQRRLMQPAFHRGRIAEFGKIMTDAAVKMVEKWQWAINKRETVDIQAEMRRLSLQIVCKALFDMDSEERNIELQQHIQTSYQYIEYRLNTFLYLPLFIPTKRHRRLKQALAKIDGQLQEIIRARGRRKERKDDLLAMLLQARDEGRLTDEWVRNEIMATIGAGYETVSLVLAWSFYALFRHPDVRRKLLGELDAILGGRVPTVDDLPLLNYTKMFIQEVLRLYPPFWGLASRDVIEGDEVCGYSVPAGTTIEIVPYAVHRDPRFWRGPERFQPENFAAEYSAGRPEFAYIPFGGGPRRCIGETFALIEIQLILATILRHYELRVAPGFEVVPECSFTLRVKGGLPMIIFHR